MSGAAEHLALAAAVAASLGALVRASSLRRVHATGVPLLVAGWLGLVLAVAPAGVRERWPLLVVAVAVGISVAWLVAGRLRGAERWLLAAGALVLTVRIPVPTGDGTAMLLGPLYLVVGLGAVLLVRTELEARDRSLRTPDRGGATRLLDVGVAVIPAIASASLLWSWDRPASAEVLAFFLVPFVVAYALVRTWTAAGVSITPAAWALLASAGVAAAVGLVQAATGEVWWNPKVIDANRFRPDVRTNSLYWDPNIYGRALVVGLLALTAWALVAQVRRRRWLVVAGATAFGALLVTALWNTYSQSSWVALAAALLVTTVLTVPPRPRRWLATVLAIAVLVSLPSAADRLSGSGEQGRQQVVRTGLALAGERPVLGWGVGSFEAAARARAQERGTVDEGLTASHTTPVTVLAELGVLGMFAYLTLLTSAAVTTLARWRRASTPAAAARARGEDAGPGWPIAPIIWAGATLVALVAHSLLYAGFFEDPTLWVALALLASLPTVEPEDEDELTPQAAAIATAASPPVPLLSGGD